MLERPELERQSELPDQPDLSWVDPNTFLLKCLGLYGAAVVVLILIVCFAQQVAAQQYGPWYGAVRGGVVFLDDMDLEDPTGTLQALGVEVDMDDGFGIAGAVGRAWALPYTSGLDADIRGELEVTYRTNSANEITAPGFAPSAADADIDAYAGMVNLYFDIKPRAWVSPYIGAGLGLLYITNGDDGGSGFAYQGMAGLRYSIHPGTLLITEYRFTMSPELEIEQDNGVTFSSDYVSHNLFVGLAVEF